MINGMDLQIEWPIIDLRSKQVDTLSSQEEQSPSHVAYTHACIHICTLPRHMTQHMYVCIHVHMYKS